MTAGNRKLAQRAIAVIVIVALLDVVGISPPIIIFFVGAGFLIWRAAQHSESRETERIFDFFISADEILRAKERQWYGFEIAEVIGKGEDVFNSMPDPPALTWFALGALHHSVGDYRAFVDHLAPIVEDESCKEYQCSAPSPQLRRYVDMLRKIEREPAIAPQAIAAFRNLERARHKNAALLLAESRKQLTVAEPEHSQSKCSESSDDARPITTSFAGPLNVITAPPPISEVLRDVYQDERSV